MQHISSTTLYKLLCFLASVLLTVVQSAGTGSVHYVSQSVSHCVLEDKQNFTKGTKLHIVYAGEKGEEEEEGSSSMLGFFSTNARVNMKFFLQSVA